MDVKPPANEPFEVYLLSSHVKFSFWVAVAGAVLMSFMAVVMANLVLQNLPSLSGANYLRFLVPSLLALAFGALAVVLIYATIEFRQRLRSPKPFLIISDNGIWHEWWTAEPIPWDAIESIGRGLGDNIIFGFKRDRVASIRFRWSAVFDHRSLFVMLVQWAALRFGRRIDLYIWRGVMDSDTDKTIAAIKRHMPFKDRP
jgi:hypothetical protein